MITLIKPDRLRKWEFYPKRPKLLTGTYMDHKWTIYNIQSSNQHSDWIMFNLDIISLRSGVVVYHDIHHTMHLSPTIKGMHRRIHYLFYDDI